MLSDHSQHNIQNGGKNPNSSDVSVVVEGRKPGKGSLTPSDKFYESGDYDPYDFCTSKRPNTYWDAFFHILKSVLGTGLFVMPKTFADVGYIVGPVGVMSAALFFCTCMHFLVNAEYELCKRRRIPNMSYGDTVLVTIEERFPKHHRLARISKFVSNLLFMMLEMGGCSCYVLFVCGNVKQLCEYYFGLQLSLRTVMASLTLLLILMGWIRTLKSLAPFSAAADLTLVLCFAGMAWYVFREPPTFAGKRPVGDLKKLPVFVSTVTFSISCIGVVMPLKAEMSKPSQFGSPAGVLNAAMAPVVMFYSAIGLLGYVKYGDGIASSVTLNLPSEELLAQCIKFFFSFPVLMSYALCYYVVLDISWTNFLKSKIREHTLVWEYIVRVGISIATVLLAAAVPDLATLVSLVGGLGMGINGLVLPVVLHTLVFWDSHETTPQFWRFFLRNVLLFLLALFIFLTGFTLAVFDVVALYYE